MHIRNALVFTDRQTFAKEDVYTAGGRILAREEWETLRRKAGIGSGPHSVLRTDVSSGTARVSGAADDLLSAERVCASADDFSELDAEGLLLLPGLVDIHSHGAVGRDFSDGDTEGLKEILAYEYAHGITSYCPTSMTLPEEMLSEIFASAAKAAADIAWEPLSATASGGKKYARIAGINMEGPFLDSAKKGAQQESFLLPPDPKFFRRCNEISGGRIRLVTVAPNLPGAMEFIREISQETVVSLGHTSCDYDTARRAFDAGARHLTHLYNAMPEFCHRNPGPIGAALDTPECMVELIADGIHSHDSAIRAAFTLFADRIVLISDSMRAVGLSDGSYTLGGQDVLVKGHLATLSDGTIAGSCTNLYDCMRHVVSAGIPVEKAVAAATANPARSIGIYDEAGSIAPGKRADLLLTAPDLTLRAVL